MMKKTVQNKLPVISNQSSAKKAESRKLKAECSQQGITALAVLTILGLFLAVSLALVGTGTLKLPWDAKIPVSPIPVSDPVEDDQDCSNPANAECEPFIYNDPEDLTPEQIQKALEAE